jgi:hypothetical protein
LTFGTTINTMQRAVVDGVTVLWRQQPGPLSAELTFGCGHRDEDLDTVGLTHFVQLLACPTPDHAEAASHLKTSFTLDGPTDQVVAELAAICSTLTAEPDPDRMAAVAKEADPGERFCGLSFDNDLRYPFASLLSRRFGPRGPGLVRWPAIDYGLFTAEQVRAHTRRCFTASNAVLTLTGPPPSGLRLPLPQGPRPDRSGFSFKSTPFWYQDEVTGAGIGFQAEPGPLPYLVIRMVTNQLDRRLRAVPDGMLLDATSHEFGITLTPRRRRAAEAVQAAWAQLRRLALSGPAAGELQAASTAIEKDAAEATARFATLSSGTDGFETEVERELFAAGESYGEEEWARMARLPSSRVRQAVAGWLRSAIIVVPRGIHPVLEGVAESACLSGGHAPPGEVFKRSLLKRWRAGSARMVLNPSGLSIVDASGTHFTAARDLVLVRDGKGASWVGDPGHGCLHDISSFGGAVDRISQVVTEARRRRVFGVFG